MRTLDADACYRALAARDVRADGAFLVRRADHRDLLSPGLSGAHAGSRPLRLLPHGRAGRGRRVSRLLPLPPGGGARRGAGGRGGAHRGRGRAAHSGGRARRRWHARRAGARARRLGPPPAPVTAREARAVAARAGAGAPPGTRPRAGGGRRAPHHRRRVRERVPQPAALQRRLPRAVRLRTVGAPPHITSSQGEESWQPRSRPTSARCRARSAA